MSNGPGPAPELTPDRTALTTFVNVLFKNADSATASCRSASSGTTAGASSRSRSRPTN